MDKFLLLISFLGMLIVDHGVAGNLAYGNIGMLEEVNQSWEMEEENEMESSLISSWASSERGNKVLVNVDSFGAVGDGVSDDTQVNLCSLRNIHALDLDANLVNEHHFSLTLLIESQGPTYQMTTWHARAFIPKLKY